MSCVHTSPVPHQLWLLVSAVKLTEVDQVGMPRENLPAFSNGPYAEIPLLFGGKHSIPGTCRHLPFGPSPSFCWKMKLICWIGLTRLCNNRTESLCVCVDKKHQVVSICVGTWLTAPLLSGQEKLQKEMDQFKEEAGLSSSLLCHLSSMPLLGICPSV